MIRLSKHRASLRIFALNSSFLRISRNPLSRSSCSAFPLPLSISLMIRTVRIRMVSRIALEIMLVISKNVSKTYNILYSTDLVQAVLSFSIKLTTDFINPFIICFITTPIVDNRVMATLNQSMMNISGYFTSTTEIIYIIYLQYFLWRLTFKSSRYVPLSMACCNHSLTFFGLTASS